MADSNEKRNQTIEQARKICINLLELNPPVNADKINESINQVKSLLPDLNGSEAVLFEKIQAIFSISMEEPRILDYDLITPWIEDKRAKSGQNWKFWNRYKDLLAQEKGFPPLIVDRLDDLSDKILNRLGDPEQHPAFDRRGMVVGHVQSGKTSNYIGLICKAADAGYKLIIVLAGIHSSLRSQTQLRVDEGFLGYDTETSRVFNQSNNRIGVGRFDRTAAAHSLTSSSLNGDFKRTIAENVSFSLRGSDPVVLVIKKNYAVLKNLINWLAGKEGEEITDAEGKKRRVINDIPMLLIDDEADNASINISRASVSSINGTIRALLGLFSQNAYIGYTATPYANIFIEPPNQDEEERPTQGIKITVGDQQYDVGDDLFPRNFIINIPPPSNYVGPERVFGIVSSEYINNNGEESAPSPIPLYRIVRDYQPKEYQDSKTLIEGLRKSNNSNIPDKHRKGDQKPVELPESLRKAIKCFILSCAGRRARGQENVHNSMLVHVTRFIEWQNHVAGKVKKVLLEYKNSIEKGDQDFINELKDIWENEYKPVTEKIIRDPSINDSAITVLMWEDVLPHIYPSASKIKIRAVHGGTASTDKLTEEDLQPLDYFEHKKGLSVIAVGGNKLSRGLTLEGLSISYYLRSSKMYDTLMQMGRWFGYRQGYLDLCRLFTSEELVSFYRHITAATEEMRAEFDRMYFLKKQPIEYGLKVRTHKGALAITAANKFRYKKVMSFSYSGELEETYQFNRNKPEDFESNFKSTQKLLKALGTVTGSRNSASSLRNQKFVWYSENNWQLIANYIANFQSPQKSFIPDLISDYIRRQAEKKKYLTNWTVALIDNSTVKEENKISLTDNIRVGLSFRKDATKDPENKALYEPTSETYEITKAHIIGNFHEYIDLTQEQLNEAIIQTKEDLRTQSKEVKENLHPNTLRIRTNRKETNGLLLIYPIDPKPDTSSDAYSQFPIMGIAISFPYIEDDEKVEYAINKVFDDALFDYPEEYDAEDTYGDIEEETEPPARARKIMSMETFIDLIENPKGEYRLDDTEIGSGVVNKKQVGDDMEGENLVLSAEEMIINSTDTFPFYEADEIQRYSFPVKNKWVLINPDEENQTVAGRVIGLKSSKYVIFAYAESHIYVPDSCWVISSGINAKYLTALFNSTLFGAWVRINGQRKKEKYFITADQLTSFPIFVPDKDTTEIIEKIVGYIQTISSFSTTDTSVIRSYFTDILDALIFALYYPVSMASTSKTIIDNLKDIPALPVNEYSTSEIQEIYKTLYEKDHPVRKEIFFLDRQDKVKRIRGVFTEQPDAYEN